MTHSTTQPAVQFNNISLRPLVFVPNITSLVHPGIKPGPPRALLLDFPGSFDQRYLANIINAVTQTLYRVQLYFHWIVMNIGWAESGLQHHFAVGRDIFNRRWGIVEDVLSFIIIL